jgi:riboflavin synthase
MFTGITEGLARVTEVKKLVDFSRITVDLGKFSDGVTIGDSISVNGACLTIAQIEGGTVTFDIMHETLKKTALGELRKGDSVNVERPMKLSDRLSGHFVLGHVDAVGVIKERRTDKHNCTIIISVPGELMRQMVQKGSVSVDGISLTVINVGADWFSIGLIPHTLDITTLGTKKEGDKVNIETDYLAKLVQKYVAK